MLSPKSKRPVKVEQPTFVPQINPISSEIDRRIQAQAQAHAQTQGSTQGPTQGPTQEPTQTETQAEGQVRQRWEQLYGLSEKKKAEREELRKQYDELQAEKDKCTFHPQLAPYDPRPHPESASATAAAAVQREGVSVEERTRLWKERKEQKLKSLKEAEQDKALEGCTFKPELVATVSRKDEDNKSSTSTEAFVASMKSVERYIEKQKLLRLQKQQTQRKAEQIAGSGTTSTQLA